MTTDSSLMAGRGKRLLIAFGALLMLAGLAVLLVGLTGRFLPHDEHFLGMTARDLCALHGCRIVHFMIHDRVSFGGAVLAIGLLYVWTAAGPLTQGQAWAWWLFLISGTVGFISFLSYLGYGYLDTWHGLAALGLLPCYLGGLIWSRGPTREEGIRRLLSPSTRQPWYSVAGIGRLCLLSVAAGMAVGGLVIAVVGMTCVFVPQDLRFMGLGVEELQAISPRLIPLIAHDRAGFGGAVCCCGVTLLITVWCGTPSRGLWQVLALVGIVGFGTAIGVHPAVGYNDPVHLAPAVLGALVYLAGLVLTYPQMMRGSPRGTDGPLEARFVSQIPVRLSWPQDADAARELQ